MSPSPKGQGSLPEVLHPSNDSSSANWDQTTGVAVSLTKAPIRSPSECRMHEGLDDVSIYQHRPNNA